MNQLTIYLDMDGVLCNFINAVEELYPGAKELQKTYYGPNRHQEHPDLANQYEDFRNAILSKENFWRDLPWTDDGYELASHIIHNANIPLSRIGIITAPMKGDEDRCYIEKNLWVQTNLPFINMNNVFVEKNKYNKINSLPGDYQILIDDHSDNIDEWIAHGGIGILHKSAKETIDILSKIL